MISFLDFFSENEKQHDNFVIFLDFFSENEKQHEKIVSFRDFFAIFWNNNN